MTIGRDKKIKEIKERNKRQEPNINLVWHRINIPEIKN